MILGILFSLAFAAEPTAPSTSPGPAKEIMAADWPVDFYRGERPTAEKGAKLILLDFWASWCVPCKQSLPYYETLQKKFAKQGVRFASISADEDRSDGEKFLKEVKFTFPAAWDKDRKIIKLLKITAIPALVALTPNGKVLAIEEGYTPASKKKMVGQITSWLKEAHAPGNQTFVE